MRRLLDWKAAKVKLDDPVYQEEREGEGSRVMSMKAVRGSHAGVGLCAECGGEVKILVSPKRNPHSSKLGRAVSMKDHDLCRKCWRRLVQRQGGKGIVEIPRIMLKGSSRLRPRLLTETQRVWPREAS